MSTNQKPSSDRPEIPAKQKNTTMKVVIVIVAVAIIAIGGVWLFSGKDTENNDAGFVTVERGPLTISVTQKGIIKSRDKVIIKNNAEGRNTIITLIEEGTIVKEGELLMELDSSEFEERKDQQEITVSNTHADYLRALETLAVTENQAKADVEKAELDLKFAELDLEKYTEGDYPLQLKQAQKDIDLATEELERAADRVDGSRRLEKDGYITKTELQADVLAETRCRLNKEMANRQLELLKTYTHKRDLEDYKSKVRQATMSLERTKRKAAADVMQAKVDLNNKKSQYNRQQDQLEKIKEQIGYCRIVSPVAGQVVYATTGQRHNWRNPDPLDKGQEVRERQELFHLPTANSMMTEIRIHESKKEAVKVGMPARITINSKPGKVFTGTLAWIAPMSTKGDWTAPNVMAFNTEIHIDSNGEKISPGGSCEVEVILKEYADVLSVPLQAVIKVKGKDTVYVQTPDGMEPRVVELGMDNGRFVHVKEGLKEGERVSLTPPLEEATEGPGEVNPAPEEKPSTQPAAKPEDKTPDLRKMTPEQKKKYMDSLTDEQRKKLAERKPAAGGRREPRGRGGNGRGD